MAVTTDPAPLAEAVAALRDVILAGERYRDVVAAHLGLTVVETRAVNYLHVSNGMGQTELGEQLGVNSSTVSAIVDRLERNGMAERTPHPTDRRRYVVRVTAQGRAMIDQAGEWLSHAFDPIDPATLSVLIPGLVAIAENVRGRAVDRVPARQSRRGTARAARATVAHHGSSTAGAREPDATSIGS